MDEPKQATLATAKPAPVATQDAPLAPVGVTDMAALVKYALEHDRVDALDKLVAMNERIAERQAQKDLVDALARFKEMCPPIPRNAVGKVEKSGVIQYTWTYADLPKIEEVVSGPCAECGLSYWWGDSVVEAGNMTTTCFVAHVNGAQRSSSYICPTETRAGMSPQGKYASAAAQSRRNSLVNALGLVTVDEDKEGGSDATITPKQAADLTALMDEVGITGERVGKFLAIYSVASVEELPLAVYPGAVRQVERKRGT